MDNGASMPVGIHYLPKSVTGNQTFSNLEEAVKTIQVCKNCICRQNAVQHIIDWKDSGCDSFCNMCWETKDVCPDCAEQGQTSYVPSLRACKRCLEMGCKCKRAIVLVVVTDCEDWILNKKALETINRMREDGTISSDYSLLIALPDAVHVGKSIKCSWANWFILLDGQRSNLVLLRTLRDSSDPDVRKKLKKLLTLECVRNKDRMAVDVIVLLTRIAL